MFGRSDFLSYICSANVNEEHSSRRATVRGSTFYRAFFMLKNKRLRLLYPTTFALRRKSLFTFGDGIWQPPFYSACNAKCKQSMNEFEKRINELRIQFRNERVQISKDADLKIGHINTAIGQVNSPEAREALRAEKQRLREQLVKDMKDNRFWYMMMREAIEEEYRSHLEKNLSSRQIRRIVRRLSAIAEEQGKTELTIVFGDNRRATVSFS